MEKKKSRDAIIVAIFFNPLIISLDKVPSVVPSYTKLLLLYNNVELLTALKERLRSKNLKYVVENYSLVTHREALALGRLS